VLWILILAAIVCGTIVQFLPKLTGHSLFDRFIGMVLGLYICALPAANAVNLLFYDRQALRQMLEWSLIRWLALNLLVLLTGWSSSLGCAALSLERADRGSFLRLHKTSRSSP
jgi:hypothetical protein